MDLLNAKNFGQWKMARPMIPMLSRRRSIMMNNAAMQELLLDLGEHEENVVVKDNIGTLVTEKTNRDAFLGEAVEEPGGTYL